MKTSQRRVVIALALMLGAALASSCSTTFKDSTSANRAGKGAPSSSAPTGQAEASTAGQSGSSPLAVNALDRLPGEAGRAVVQTASMTVETDDVSEAKRRVEQIARDAGGFVFSEQTTFSETAKSVITLKVAPEAFTGVLDELSRLGQLASQEIKTEDMTQQLIDLDARIDAIESSLGRVHDLLDKAPTLAETSQLEQEVAKRQAELESLRGQRKALEQRVSFSTVVLTLTSDKAPTPAVEQAKQRDLPGFLDGLQGGWYAFTGVLSVTGAVIGAVLPFLPFVVVPMVLWKLLARRRRAASAAGVGTLA